MCAFCAKCLLLSEQNVLPRHGFLKWLYYLVVDTSMKNGPRERASERTHACRQPTEAACKLKYLNEPLLWTDFRVHYYNIFLTLDDGSNIWTRKKRARLQRAHTQQRRSLSQPASAANQQWDTLFPRGIPLSTSRKQSTLYLFNLHSHYSDYLSHSEAFLLFGLN